MSALTDKFKRRFIYVEDSAQSIRVQKLMFALGFAWAAKLSGEVRTTYDYHRHGGYMSIDENCRITAPLSSFVKKPGYTSVGESELEAAVKEHKAGRTKARKESRKRSKLRKQGYTIWKGNATGDSPVSDVLVQVVLRNGETRKRSGDGYRWNHCPEGTGGYDYDIVAYKVIKPEGKVISPDELVMAVAADIGKVVVAEVPEVTLNVPGYAVDYTFKDTNPKKQFGDKSIPLNMWSQLASAYGALGLYNGSLKYGKANFANTPVEASIYIAAAQRHLAAWAAGEENDPADGVPNLGGVLANIAILLEARAAGMLIDDRLKMEGYLKEREELKKIVADLQKLHEGKTPHHYTRDNAPKGA